jgi:hypothetical protein
MMRTSGLARDGGREAPADVAAAIVEAIEQDRLEVARGDTERLAMAELNKTDPARVDEALAAQKPMIEAAARDHSAL